MIVDPIAVFAAGMEECSSGLMVGIEWTLTHKLGLGECLKTTNLKMHSVWDLLLLGHLESYTKPCEIASFKICSCICLCLNQFIHF